MSKQVVVSGGGAAGTMAAYMAAKNGHKVTLFEKNENGSIRYLVIEQNHNIKNFFSRGDDIKVSFESIEKIGSDVILVNI